jgi:DNA-binding response OmpR family regulator
MRSNENLPKRFRVLLVDDEPDFLRLAAAVLSTKYDVMCLTTGAALIEQLDALRPDLVVLDLKMPGTDGVELCRRIRSSGGYGDLPIAFLTASRQEPDFLRGLEAGADTLLYKPISPAELHDRIDELLRLAAQRPN